MRHAIDGDATLPQLDAILEVAPAGRVAEEIAFDTGSIGVGLGSGSDLALATRIARDSELRFGLGCRRGLQGLVCRGGASMFALPPDETELNDLQPLNEAIDEVCDILGSDREALIRGSPKSCDGVQSLKHCGK